MYMHTELLYHLLSERYAVTRHGHGLRDIELRLPEFYERAAELRAGGVYIVRTQELPRSCKAECLFLAVGGFPSDVHFNWMGEVLYVDEPLLDILSLSNTVNRLYDKVLSWHHAMRELVDKNAEITELVSVSLPLFENCVTIANYDLQLLVNCEMTESDGIKSVHITRDFERIPEYVSATFVEEYGAAAERKKPFFHKGQREDPEGDNYCINMHSGNTYIGTCVLWNRYRPMRQSDYLLFGCFTEYVKQLLCASQQNASSGVTTFKNIFADLLQRFPVSLEEYNEALCRLDMALSPKKVEFGAWNCLVIRSVNKGKTLPEKYLCASLEDMLPFTSAIARDGQIVCFSMIPKGQDCESTVLDILRPYLSDMNFCAGVSEIFDDLFDACDYYLQARAALETGGSLAPEQRIYRFTDYALPYMLRHCAGEFKAPMMLTRGLQEIQKKETGVDYWDTLRRYLDNECNASRTAQELYLHRSSLLPRLERLRTLIDMDTPEQRLYLRMCIYMKEYSERSKITAK